MKGFPEYLAHSKTKDKRKTWPQWVNVPRGWSQCSLLGGGHGRPALEGTVGLVSTTCSRHDMLFTTGPKPMGQATMDRNLQNYEPK
jgi:hypothetical protein